MTKQKARSRYAQIYEFLGSKAFFWVVVAIFAVQAMWLASTANYPMAFDEDFHFGLIKIYAHHIWPFWLSHPAGGDAFGALTRDPSYMYHYLMSFPYRLTSLFVKGETGQVMVFRFLNIALFSWGLVLFRKLMLKIKASSPMVHLSLLIFVLVPVVPYLGGQINYDNLLFPLTAIALLLTIKLSQSFKDDQLDANAALSLATLLLLTSLVKYAFLPIVAAIVGYLAYVAYKSYHRPRKLLLAAKKGLVSVQKTSLIALILVFALTSGLFIERYGVNIVKYHTPVADCGQVLDFEHCKSYGPWLRDYLQVYKNGAKPNPVIYTGYWFQGMWARCLFAVSGVKTDFQSSGSLTVPAYGSFIFGVFAALAIIIKARTIWSRYDSRVLWLFSVVSISYVAVLWLDEYHLYKKSGAPVAINGRYLLPVLPLIILVSVMAINLLLKRFNGLKIAAGSAAVICLLWGGGALTYVLRSSDSWYWPHTPLKAANHTIKDVIGPITPGYKQPVQFMPK
ncbi:MAG: hypothetical protein ACXWLH_00070 [Candidatus Saccharimonadales bacterium]